MSDHTTEIDAMEHDALSPGFIALLRFTDDLGHSDTCRVCNPPIYESGLVGRMWTKALDCPLCGEQIKRGAAVLVRIDYDRHLTERHYPPTTSPGKGRDS